jgi:putative Mn2+ efflux pump MntP
MNFIEIVLIALGLSMDCFAVSLSFGAQKKLWGKVLFRTALSFAFFQAMMPVLGWAIGISVKSMLSEVDHWIAFALLAAIGLRMIYESFKSEHEKKPVDISEWKVLITLSLATSIDAMITGLSFGFIQVNILLAVLTIGIITFVNSLLGAWVGHRAIHISPRWAEFAGGIVLIGIGVKIVATHIVTV